MQMLLEYLYTTAALTDSKKLKKEGKTGDTTTIAPWINLSGNTAF
jgi:hypothetical protein